MATYDVFISYAWSDPRTRTFAHDLAAYLHLAGFNVGIDVVQDYGSSPYPSIVRLNAAKLQFR